MMSLSAQISDLIFLLIMGLLATLVAVPLCSIAAEWLGRMRPGLEQVLRRWNPMEVSTAIRSSVLGAMPESGLVKSSGGVTSRTGEQVTMVRMQGSWPARRKQPQPRSNRRRFVRVGTDIQGYVVQNYRLAECEILDLSFGGARVRIDGSSADQTHLTLGIGRFGTIAGEVVWRRKGVLGLKYADTPQVVRQALAKVLPQTCMAS